MGSLIELSTMIAELRRELSQAIAAGADEQLRFGLGPVEVEVTAETTPGVDRKATSGSRTAGAVG